MPSPEQQLAENTARQIEIREELELLQSGYSPDGPPELKEAELMEELDQLTVRAKQLRAMLDNGWPVTHYGVIHRHLGHNFNCYPQFPRTLAPVHSRLIVYNRKLSLFLRLLAS